MNQPRPSRRSHKQVDTLGPGARTSAGHRAKRLGLGAALAIATLTILSSPVAAQSWSRLEFHRSTFVQAKSTPEEVTTRVDAGENIFGVGPKPTQENAGNPTALFQLGVKHETGSGVIPDPAKALEYYERAARQGCAAAQYNAGNMYAAGRGTKSDLFAAVLWFRQAAEQDLPEAQYNLALAYELGRGVSTDDATAQRWYRAAAAQGYAPACHNLALMLEEGRGAPRDPAAALRLYREAALRNFAPAQINLGVMLAEGRAVERDLVQGFAWLSVGVANGGKPVGRDLVAEWLTTAERLESEQTATKLRVLLGLAAPAPAANSGF